MRFSGLMRASAIAALLSVCSSPALAQELTLNSKNYSTPSWTKLTRLMAQMQNASQPYLNFTYRGCA